MKIEQQVTSLELSKKLRELGVKQESLFYWVEGDMGGMSISQLDVHGFTKDHVHCSAFTVAELGEMLPAMTESKYFSSDFGEHDGENWGCNAKEAGYKFIMAKTEADARAKMLIYLIEKKLVEE